MSCLKCCLIMLGFLLIAHRAEAIDVKHQIDGVGITFSTPEHICLFDEGTFPDNVWIRSETSKHTDIYEVGTTCAMRASLRADSQDANASSMKNKLLIVKMAHFDMFLKPRRTWAEVKKAYPEGQPEMMLEEMAEKALSKIKNNLVLGIQDAFVDSDSSVHLYFGFENENYAVVGFNSFTMVKNVPLVFQSYTFNSLPFSSEKRAQEIQNLLKENRALISRTKRANIK